MYCKNCGKRLPDGARFCDRCNTSVRKKSAKQELIDDLKEERLARRKAKAVEERFKKIKKMRHRRYKIITGVIIAFVLLGVISAITTNIIISKNSTFNSPIEDVPDVTEEPTATATPETAVSLNSDGYIVTKILDTSFVYPSSFTDTNDSTSGFLSLVDSVGDAAMTAGEKTASETDAASAMKSYIDRNGLMVEKASTSDNCYFITGTSGDNRYHKCGCITNGAEIYYEFIYPLSSAKSSAYETNTEYMDSYFKAAVQ